MLASEDFKNRKSGFQPLKPGENPKTRVLILRSGALGDTLMLLPGLIQLKNRAEIFLAGRMPGIEFLKPYVAGCLDYEGPGWHQLFAEVPKALGLPPWPQVDLVVAYSAADAPRLQHNLEFFFPGSKIHLFPALPEQGRDLHVALYLAQALAKAGLDLVPEKAWAAAFEQPLLDSTGPALATQGPVFHPGSGSAKKNLPPDFWVALIQAMRRVSELQEAILLLGPAEESLLSYFRETREEHGAQIIFAPDNQALLRLLKEAAFYVGHDSGITHLAALLGRLCIALFKESSLAQWRPLGPRVKIIEAHAPEEKIVAQVLQMARSFLSEKRAQVTGHQSSERSLTKGNR